MLEYWNIGKRFKEDSINHVELSPIIPSFHFSNIPKGRLSD
jgi:hypothetical protein